MKRKLLPLAMAFGLALSMSFLPNMAQAAGEYPDAREVGYNNAMDMPLYEDDSGIRGGWTDRRESTLLGREVIVYYFPADANGYVDVETGAIFYNYCYFDNSILIWDEKEGNFRYVDKDEVELPAEHKFTVENNILVRYEGPGGDITIPDGIMQIHSGAFYGYVDYITGITLPSSMIVLGDSAFGGMKNLTHVELNEGLVTIRNSAFGYCAKLASITIPSTVRYIGRTCFENCTGLTSVTLSEGLITIDQMAFRNCKSLQSIHIPASVTNVGPAAFLECSSLTQVTADGHQNYEGNVFGKTPWESAQGNLVILNGEALLAYHGDDEAVVIPEGVKRISGSAFARNTGLKSVTIPDSAEAIGDGAFSGCTSLSTVMGGRGVTYVNYNAFEDTPWLENLGDWSVLGTVLFGYHGTDADVEVPEGIQFIMNNTFIYSKNNIRSIQFPKSLAVLRSTALPNNALSSWSINQAAEFWRFQQAHDWLDLDRPITAQSKLVQETSDKIVADAGAVTDYEKAKAICQWVNNEIRYESYSKYRWIEPETTLLVREGVCADYENLTAALLYAQGIPCFGVSGATDDSRHGWNMIWADQRWVHADPTWGIFDYTEEAILSSGHNDQFTAYTHVSPSAWAIGEVKKASLAHLIPGDLQCFYSYNITRQEFCRLAVNLIEEKTGMTAKDYAASLGKDIADPFNDTDHPDVLAAYALGIVNGTSDTTFNPRSFITRQEAATMLARTAKLLGLNAGQSASFSDLDDAASWATESISFVSELTDSTSGNRVMGGVGNNNFGPTLTYTREQAYITFLRLFHCK